MIIFLGVLFVFTFIIAQILYLVVYGSKIKINFYNNTSHNIALLTQRKKYIIYPYSNLEILYNSEKILKIILLHDNKTMNFSLMTPDQDYCYTDIGYPQIYLQLNKDQKIYISKNHSFPISSLDTQPKGYPLRSIISKEIYIAPIETCAKLREYRKGVSNGHKETVDGQRKAGNRTSGSERRL